MLEKSEDQRRRGQQEDEMVGWHHQLSGYEFEQTLKDSEAQGSLAWCSPWGHKESDTTEWLNNTTGVKDTGTGAYLLCSIPGSGAH